MHPDKVYQELLKDVLENGELTTTRAKDPKTGQPVRAYSVFGRQVRFNLREGFPLLTTKKMFTKGIIHELLWFLKGDTNVKYLQDNGVHIWDEWANKDGELVSCYGQQWRRWEALKENTSPTAELAKKLGANTPYQKQDIDQIANVIEEIKANPTSRRLIVSAWNPSEVDQASLPWCHAMFQFKVSHNSTRLNCQLYQRSADIFLGVPFNIVSYALLTHMIAQVCGLEVGDFIHTFGDLHLYKNHIEQVKLQLTREPHPLPTLVLNSDIKCIDGFKYEDIKIENYTSHPSIKGDVAV